MKLIHFLESINDDDPRLAGMMANRHQWHSASFERELASMKARLAYDDAEKARASWFARPEFLRWFGNSKVVDSEGRPLQVYHGTAGDFTEFDPARRGQITGALDTALGFWFVGPAPGTDRSGNVGTKRASDAADEAAIWQNDSDDTSGAAVMPVYLRIKKPKIFKRPMGDTETTARQIAAAKSAGYDGVIYLHGESDRWGFSSGSQYLVFDSKQIKSVFNAGNFNPDSANISERIL